MPTEQVTVAERRSISSGPVAGAPAVALKGSDITPDMALKFGDTAAKKAGVMEPTVKKTGGVYCFHFHGSTADRAKWVAELMKLEEEGKILPKNIVRVSAKELKFPEGGNAIRYNNN